MRQPNYEYSILQQSEVITCKLNHDETTRMISMFHGKLLERVEVYLECYTTS